MKIWPAIDLRGGNCVRLQQGDYDRETVFGEDPVKMAEHWVSQGAQCMHLVDLDGARDGNSVNANVIAEIVKAISLPCQVGGGIRSEERIQSMLDVGVARLVVGTKALKDPDWFSTMAEKFPGKLVLGLDARDGQVATDGWLETSDVDATDMAKRFEQLPIAAIVYTDIARDGMMVGPNVDAMKKMNDAVNVEVVASGGVSKAADITDLKNAGMPACIVGRALYDKAVTLPEIIELAR
ncbi:MAG: 1-(5-phosphoribosyl)-5-[(5-phosphoribosylamino)methylideneamino]imidazole-4-carboxamide isomerase [Planctomycetales bacterium]|nr:1-(5-phosphoribosyl)-5-[(5-phosphoribosylamino)methylideneamino]imidazole-4-carboxamide isomerase [Planctomycetales bacterium]